MSMSEVRAELPRVLDRVEAGEDIVVTRHGKPVAVVVRLDRVRARAAESAYAVADDLDVRIEQARRAPLPAPSLSNATARDLVADVDRSRGPR